MGPSQPAAALSMRIVELTRLRLSGASFGNGQAFLREERAVGCREPRRFRQKMCLLWRTHSDAQHVRMLGPLDGLAG